MDLNINTMMIVLMMLEGIIMNMIPIPIMIARSPHCLQAMTDKDGFSQKS
jgi:hypothetical protein